MKLRLRSQMIFGFMIMSALLVLVAGFAILYTNRMQQNSARILNENVTSLKAAEELEIALLDMKGITANYLLDGEARWLEVFAEKKNSFLYWLNNARNVINISEEKTALDEIETKFAEYLEIQAKIVGLHQAGNSKAAYDLLTNEMRAKFYLIFNHSEELLTLNEKMMANTSTLIKQENQMVKRILYSIGALGTILGLALALFFARSITHPIYELVLKVKGVINQEVYEKVNIGEDSELEGLSHHVRKLIDKVQEINENLGHSHKMLLRSEKLAALGQMSAGLAHEIRNPLTAIKMLIFSISKQIHKNNQIKNDFAIITKEIERLEAFLQNFLDFARPPEPNLRPIDIDSIIKDTINLLSPQTRMNKIKVHEALNAHQTTTYGDKELLQQVFVNVSLNAIQSMEHGGVLEYTSMITNEHDQLIARITIRDTGKGIPDELLDKIFDPFITTKAQGTGLGLSIAHQIIHQQGGWIDALNNPDQGSSFIIYLPIRKGLA